MKLSSIIKLATLVVASVTLAFAQFGRAGGRPERFDTDEVKTLSGTITNVDHPYATFKAEDGKEYRVHMGPYWFWERREYSLKVNTKARVKGEVEDVKGALHFYPWEIIQDGKTLTLADDDGIPSWAGKRTCRGYGKGAGYGGGRGRAGWGRGCGRCW